MSKNYKDKMGEWVYIKVWRSKMFIPENRNDKLLMETSI